VKKGVMVDLETRGNVPGCAILSIGAVAFDETGVDESAKFYTVLNTASCHAIGLFDNLSTMAWWEKQAPEARGVLDEALVSETGIVAGLTKFGAFLGSVASLGKIQVWGNGADFDNAILAAAYHAAEIELPWLFWNNRCYRSLKSLIKGPKLERAGTHHNALDDAISQARHAVQLLNSSGLRL